jgi:16S rRNA (guanine(1405)-N(7))-methyltransferase
MDDFWAATEAGRAVVEQTAAALVRRYRLDEEAAHKAVAEALGADADLTRTAAQLGEPARILRLARFRRLESDLRRRVYYDLRRYRADPTSMSALAEQLAAARDDDRPRIVQQLLECHASTRERRGDLPALRSFLGRVTADARTMLDVGCGVFPLAFPFAERERPLESYRALDRDEESLAAVRAFARGTGLECLATHAWRVVDGWGLLGGAEFDVALLLKVVPVVARQEREHLAELAAVPARRLVVSGSRLGLAKRRDIERRERGTIQRFLGQRGARVVEEFVTADEFFVVAE